MEYPIVTSQEELTVESEEITKDQHEEVFGKLEEVVNTLRTVWDIKSHGVSAVQIGIPVKAFIVYDQGVPIRFANAEIHDSFSDECYWSIKDEMCLSILHGTYKVKRRNKVKVSDDINGTKVYTGKLAKIIQHEYDHTQGLTLEQTGDLIFSDPMIISKTESNVDES